jgi:uncharacterized protein YbaP (TraB family)
MMMKLSCKNILFLCFIFVSTQQLFAEEIQCRPFEIIKVDFTGPDKFSNGVLWKVSGNDNEEKGYIFGTIHVDDQVILDLPDPVISSLKNAKHFAMEAIPLPEDAIEFSKLMFFTDGNRLDKLLPKDIFNKTESILKSYGLTREMVTHMKPWAAYIIMSYPASMNVVLDLHLLKMAQNNGAQVSGLESSSEQISIFSDIDINQQVRILVDTVCHYETLLTDMNELKKLYLERDLKGLYDYSQRYTFGDDFIYEKISQNLISDRNCRMVERMRKTLEKGQAFIAVGAMHLPGADGILNILEQNNYKVVRVY